MAGCNGPSGSKPLAIWSRTATASTQCARKCWHRADLDMDALIARFGAGFRHVGPELDRRLRCAECDGKAVSVQVNRLSAGRRARKSRFQAQRRFLEKVPRRER